MADDSDWWLLLPEPVRRFPADLSVTVALVAATVLAVFLPVVSDSPLRILFGLAFVLFLPGYAFVAALFPESGDPPMVDGAAAGDDATVGGGAAAGDASMAERVGDRGIDGIERVALSFGLSIAITPLLGLVLNFTPWGIRLVPIVVAVGGFTLLAAVLAARRRWELPEDERFQVPYREWAASGREELFQPETRADAALNALLVVSVVVAAASVSYAVAVPKQGESFTEFYVLTENESGDLVADGYPTEFVAGESKPVVVGVSNQEHEQTRYSVVIELHRVEFVQGANNTTRIRVLEEEELDRFGTQLDHNETWHRDYEVASTMTGTNLRLTFLLYRGSPPADPTVDNAYRELHLWVNVSEPGSGG
jgi:uncharacterized membrane protein